MGNLFPPFYWSNLLIIPGLLIGYTAHELGHALMAYYLGDYSQVERGKITLNPLEHISWFGSLAFLLFGVGWPKPMQANPYNFKRKYLDLFLVAISGPVASLTFSLIGLLVTLTMAAIVVYQSGATTDQVFTFLFPVTADLPQTLDLQAWTIAFTGYIAITNFWLTFVSLLPLPGLDGFTAITSLLAFRRERKEQKPSVEGKALVPDQPMTLISQRHRRNSAAEIHFNIGTEYHQDQQYDDAIARYRQALGSDEHFGPAYINMGLAYLAKGRRKEAIQAFRGAIQYADEQKSQAEAWLQLHQLSEVSPTDQETARESMAEMGASPWTDTKPRPNWLGLSLSGAVLLTAGLFLYGYLLTQLIELLKR